MWKTWPFFVKDDEGFKELVACFDSSYKLPSKTTFSRTISLEKYDLVGEKIQIILSNATYIILTTDM